MITLLKRQTNISLISKVLVGITTERILIFGLLLIIMAPLIPILTIGKIILTIPLDSYSEPWFWKVMRGFLDDDDPAKPYCEFFFSSEPNCM
jgi:hypothetical protein